MPGMRTRFDPAREAAFRADYAQNSLLGVRFGLGLGAALYALFAPLDIWMLPQSWPIAHLIRFGAVVPVCLATLALTFVPRARAHLQALVSVFVAFAGLGIVAMIAAAQAAEPGYKYYYAGLMLVLTFSFTVVRLRFLPTAGCCVVIIVAYEVVALGDQRLLAEGLLGGQGPVFINNNFFLLTAGLIATIGAYLLENYARRDFQQRHELMRTLDELKATQAQLVQVERTSAMARVVAGLLHELNSPVGAIASAADVVGRASRQLTSEPSAAKREKTLALMVDSARVLREATQRVAHTLDVLKRFSHLDMAETADYNVNGALSDCLTLLAPETGERITVERQFGDVPRIRCRPSEINQLFMSLLKNAVEAIRDTGTIEIRTSASDGMVRVDINDTGVGIAPDQLKDVFVPKFSRDRSRVKLGLGLVTCQNVVSRHGGTIEVDSRVGEGTRVTVTLPVKGRESTAAGPERG